MYIEYTLKYCKTCSVIKQSIGEKLHIELNSITKLFHPKGLIRYCKDYSKFGKKVNLNCDVLSWYLIGINPKKTTSYSCYSSWDLV